MRLVIVDDNPMALSIICRTLRTNPDYVVQACATAGEGIAACLDPTDLAIFDNRLPDLAGVEAVAQLRAHPQTRHLPIIVITGDSDRQTRLAAIRAGATDFLQKPISVDELQLRVRNLLALNQAQKQSAERQALLETLIAASGAHIAVADARSAETPVLFVSDSLLALTARSTWDVVGRPPGRLWDGAPVSCGRQALEAAVTAREPGRFVIPVSPAGGMPGWVDVTLTPMPGPGPAAQYLVFAQQDVTDMIDMREAHDRLAGRLADIARVSGAWFFEIDATRHLTYVSETLAQALGTTPAQVLGLPVDQLPLLQLEGEPHFPWDDAVPVLPPAPVVNEMVVLRLANGRTRAVQLNAVPFHDAQGAFAGYRGHASDVSEIARARDQAAKASRAKTVLLTTMSHEMRTPLTAIIGLAELMAREPLPAAQKEHLDEIAHAATGLTHLLSDVLDVADMEQGRLTLAVAPFDPASVVSQAVAPLRPAARARGLTFDWRTEGTCREQRLGDGGRVRQIVQALVSNAVKFTEQGGVSVLLDCGRPGSIQLTVSDTGIGMHPDEQETAFTPFMQADTGIARRFDGAGLGLSIARWLVEAMHGSISLTSAPGQGTTLRVSLPLPRVDGVAPRTFDLAGWRVLVADDNLTNRKILHAMLRRMGAEVTLCEDGPEALENWQHGTFDALLLDINMPKMAGTDVIRTIRRHEARQGIAPVPAIAVTANARPDQVARYRQVGFDGCVPKPFTGAALAAALLEHAGTPV